MGHVSYILPLLLATTGRKGAVQRVHAFSRERVLKRLQMGANRKDLFYHLVRAYNQSSSASSRPQEAAYRVVKSCLKLSALLLVMSPRMGY
jgi:hypothetical protein